MTQCLVSLNPRWRRLRPAAWAQCADHFRYTYHHLGSKGCARHSYYVDKSKVFGVTKSKMAAVTCGLAAWTSEGGREAENWYNIHKSTYNIMVKKMSLNPSMRRRRLTRQTTNHCTQYFINVGHVVLVCRFVYTERKMLSHEKFILFAQKNFYKSH